MTRIIVTLGCCFLAFALCLTEVQGQQNKNQQQKGEKTKQEKNKQSKADKDITPASYSYRGRRVRYARFAPVSYGYGSYGYGYNSGGVGYTSGIAGYGGYGYAPPQQVYVYRMYPCHETYYIPQAYSGNYIPQTTGVGYQPNQAPRMRVGDYTQGELRSYNLPPVPVLR